MSKSKIIHARIDDDIHDQLLEKCNELGCNLSDYFVSVLTGSLDDIDELENETQKLDKQYPKYDLELNFGKVTDKENNLIGYLKGFPKPKIKFIHS